MDRVRHVLADLVVPAGVVSLPERATKGEVLERLGRLAATEAGVRPEHERAVLDALREREEILSTGIGLGVAVPHVRHAHVPRETLRVGRSATGLAFDSIDGKPVHAVFTILMPAGDPRRHVAILGAIAGAVKEPGRRARAFAAPDASAFVEALLGPA